MNPHADGGRSFLLFMTFGRFVMRKSVQTIFAACCDVFFFTYIEPGWNVTIYCANSADGTSARHVMLRCLYD